MSKKLYGLLLPVLAMVAFASMSAAAQAAPQWHICAKVAPHTGLYNNDSCTELGGIESYELKLLTATKVHVSTFGRLTLTAHGGAIVTCWVSDRGLIWNEGGAGKDEITGFENYECESNFCTAGLALTAGGLPWHTKLVAGPPIRDEIEKVQVTLKCTTPARNLTFEGTLKPAWVNDDPSFAEFEANSGVLTEKATGETAAVSGDDFTVETAAANNVIVE